MSAFNEQDTIEEHRPRAGRSVRIELIIVDDGLSQTPDILIGFQRQHGFRVISQDGTKDGGPSSGPVSPR
jgi:hypothetical protein